MMKSVNNSDSHKNQSDIIESGKVIPMTKRQQVIELFGDHPDWSSAKIAEVVGTDDSYVRRILREEKESLGIDSDITIHRERTARRTANKKNREFIERIQELERELELTQHLESLCQGKVYKICTERDSGTSATAFAIASDWHSEERVKPSQVNDLNEFTLEVAERRIELFFQNTLKLVKAKRKDIKIDTLVLALLGDFFSGNIHEDVMESAQLGPAEACVWVFERVHRGIKFLLKNSDLKIIIPCHSGNHARITKGQRIANEAGNSQEYLSYHFLARQFADEPRVEFRISEGYHSYLHVGGFKIRFHHGHWLKYSGGVGGLYIPVHKKIAKWNEGRRADLDVFGHYHQLIFAPQFICNGSLIGHAPYGIYVGATYQKPKQAFFLVHHQRQEVIDQCPIWLEPHVEE